MNFVDETADDLRSLIERDFGRLPSGDLDEVTVLDWIHHRARMIPQRRRLIYMSAELGAKAALYPAINQIKAAFEAGSDVSPWLSNRVRTRKADPKADPMFNDWQISHFHLGNIIGPRNTIKRTGQLLFAHVRADHAVFLDVQPHGSWSQQKLIEILSQARPADLPILKGVTPPRTSYTDAEHSKLRRHGISRFVMADNKLFLPSGVSTSQHATRLCLLVQRLKRLIVKVRNELHTNSLRWPLREQLVNTIGLPVRLGISLDAGCLAVYEKTRRVEFARFTSFE